MGDINTLNDIEIAHGKYVYSNTSGSIYVSATRQNAMITSGFIKPVDSYKEDMSRFTYMSAHSSGVKDLGGFSIGKILSVPDGHILKVCSVRKINGRDYLNAALLILIHSSAGLICIDASLPSDEHNCIGSAISVFLGRGIVLSNEDVHSLGYELNGRFANMYRSQEELDEAFTVQSIGSGSTIESFTSITDNNGVVSIMAVKPKRKRKITLM